MRRKDREVTDTEKINNIINNCSCCRIGFNDNAVNAVAVFKLTVTSLSCKEHL